MKASRNNIPKQSKQGISNKPRPEVRDDLDSRKEKERGFKGDKSKKGEMERGRGWKGEYLASLFVFLIIKIPYSIV